MIKCYKQRDRPFKEFEEVIIFRDKQTLYRNIIFSKLTTHHLWVLGSLKYFGGQTRGVCLKNISARKVKFKFFLSAPTRTWHEEGYWNSRLHTWLCLFDYMYTHNHVDKYKTISQSRLTEKCIVHAARKVNWWKYRRHAKCTLHMVCLKQSKLYVLQNVIGVIYLNGQWPYWPNTLFEICPHKPNAMIKWIKMVYFGLASCQLFQFWQERPSFWLESGGLCYTCCVCWQGPDYFINQLLVWSLTLFVLEFMWKSSFYHCPCYLEIFHPGITLSFLSVCYQGMLQFQVEIIQIFINVGKLISS